MTSSYSTTPRSDAEEEKPEIKITRMSELEDS